MKQLRISYSKHNVYSSVSALKNQCLPWNNLILLLEGQMVYQVDGERVELGAGSVLFLPKGGRRIRLATEGLANFFVFNFYCDTPLRLPTVTKNAVQGAVYSLLCAYDALHTAEPFGNPEETEHLLGCLLAVLERRSRTQAYSALTGKIVEYLHQNFRKNVTLEQIGRVTFFSPVYCDAVFKKDTGSTILSYVLALRIQEAKRLLLEEDLDMSRIAEAVGFHSGNYFSRLFKKRVGCTPSAYRAHKKEKSTC